MPSLLFQHQSRPAINLVQLLAGYETGFMFKRYMKL